MSEKHFRAYDLRNLLDTSIHRWSARTYNIIADKKVTPIKAKSFKFMDTMVHQIVGRLSSVQTALTITYNRQP